MASRGVASGRGLVEGRGLSRAGPRRGRGLWGGSSLGSGPYGGGRFRVALWGYGVGLWGGAMGWGCRVRLWGRAMGWGGMGECGVPMGRGMAVGSGPDIGGSLIPLLASNPTIEFLIPSLGSRSHHWVPNPTMGFFIPSLGSQSHYWLPNPTIGFLIPLLSS